jgi:phosphoribosyl 1,2-cyclic phosphodiesterase
VTRDEVCFSSEVRVFVLGTGSTGNCVVVESGGERVLVDAGLNPTRATERMRALGADFVGKRAPLGVFVTHDHGDHSAQALPVARALRAPIYAHERAPLPAARRRFAVRDLHPGRPIPLGPFVVETVLVPHDAAHVAVRISAGGARVAIATDVGHATRDLHALLAGSDLVLLESNYCARLLEAGPYPTSLKRRVGGPLGHLSNHEAAALVASLEGTRVGRVALIHLSRANNTPDRALDAVSMRARRIAVEALDHGEGRRFEVDGAASPSWGEQLALGF